MKTKALLLLASIILLLCNSTKAIAEKVESNSLEVPNVQHADDVSLDKHEASSDEVVINGRHYYFFGESFFNDELYLPFINEDDYCFLKQNPIVKAYFFLIYPASCWLDDDSLHILEIL